MITIQQRVGVLCLLSMFWAYGLSANVFPVQGDDSNSQPASANSGRKKLSWFGRKSDKAATPKQEKKKSEEVGRKNDPERDIYQWFKTYSEVVGLVEGKAFRSVDFSKFIQGSLKAAVAEVDAHSAFLNQESYKATMESTSGEFSGIGVSIISKSPDDDALVIVDVIPGGPAEKAGLRGGDKIVEVEGKKLKGLSTDEAVNTLKGKPGTTVKVKLIRRRKPLELKVTRDVIKDQPSVSFFFKSARVYYLSLRIFTENAASQMADLLKIANAGKCKGIILDLRRNPGGTLQSAIEMAGLFLDKGSLVTVTKDRDRKVVDKYFTSTDPILKTDVPIIILIDNFTASAAEILAGSLRYHSIQSYERRTKKNGHNLLVFLVGTSTFGKGSVQEVIPISNGCALKLTTMLYYLPDDLSIQATGIEPDLLVKPKFVPVDEMKWITEMYGKEASLKRHITMKEATGKEDKKAAEKSRTDKKVSTSESDDDSLADIIDFEEAQARDAEEEENKGEDAPKKWEDKQKELLGSDIQVQTAVNVINMLTIARKSDSGLADRQKALEFLKQNYMTDDKVEVEKVK